MNTAIIMILHIFFRDCSQFISSTDLINLLRALCIRYSKPFHNNIIFDRSMCSDLVYVILFPQLLMVVHFKHHCNTYGSLAAYIVALLVRLSGGEAMLGLPPLIEYPGWDGERQLFPFRTMAMLISLGTLAGVSWLSRWVLFENLSE